jgi:amidase/6-aminohexanoate-cyclic-dimer hydrolase
VQKAADLLSDLGHDVTLWAPDPSLDVPAMMLAWTKIVAAGTAGRVEAILNGAPLDPTLLDGVTRGAIAYAKTVTGADYVASLGAIHAFGRRMAGAFADCDVLLSPTLATPPCKVGYLAPHNEDFVAYRNGPGSVFDYSPYCAIFNASGQPAVSLPLHWSASGLPVGVHMAMPFGADATLMRLCGQVERAANWWGNQAEVDLRKA